MAGLESYERVYRGKPVSKSWETGNNFPYIYHGQEVIRPLDVPVVHPLVEDNPPSEGDLTVKKYMVASCGLATLITETLLVHPLIVLRRQCQVNPGLSKYHIIPITLVPVVIRLHQTQGINTLWKGIGSVLLVKGMLLAIEDFISKITPWPKEITCNSSLKAFGQHILLKCISLGLVAPFYSASLVETVQSEIASESPGILDVFRDGAIRLVEVSNKGRLIPIYSLLPPTIAYGVSKYLFTLAVQGVTSRIMHIRQKQSQELRGAYSRDLLSETVTQDIELQSSLVSTFLAEALFYPWETVIHRLHLQGTRTIIDNLDTGRSVTPLLTGYSSARDCYSTIISTEGPLGLYKGFGALMLEFTVNIIIVRVIKWAFTELRTVLRPKPKSREPINTREPAPHWYYNNI
ncbi:solute carrier family 25 member 46-like [Bombus vosnesenskii]|uniref:Solute carrier family 25 member 46-like n=1 Tax=Bombus vosnesenskii TaxID=207650 RepID=A0A6J3K781_9HYME|nr:solute carrier family 25 member 46-like [Bombus vosnesenskii]XP_050490119.1 mitochondrial outer membrane protein SLC25A46-like [Bombus huntii]